MTTLSAKNQINRSGICLETIWGFPKEIQNQAKYVCKGDSASDFQFMFEAASVPFPHVLICDSLHALSHISLGTVVQLKLIVITRISHPFILVETASPEKVLLQANLFPVAAMLQFLPLIFAIWWKTVQVKSHLMNWTVLGWMNLSLALLHCTNRQMGSVLCHSLWGHHTSQKHATCNKRLLWPRMTLL